VLEYMCMWRGGGEGEMLCFCTKGKEDKEGVL